MVYTQEFMHAADVAPGESAAFLQPDRVKPKLGNLVPVLNVDMNRFIAVARVEEEAVRTNSGHCWHRRFSSRFSSSAHNAAAGQDRCSQSLIGFQQAHCPALDRGVNRAATGFPAGRSTRLRHESDKARKGGAAPAKASRLPDSS
jgi:hypothetical protein